VNAQYARNQALAGEANEARRIGEEARDLAVSLGLKDVESHTLNTIGLAKFQVGDPTWLEDLERSVELTAGQSSREAIRAYNNPASLLSSAGELHRALPLWAEARGMAERLGDRQTARFIEGTEVWAEYLIGEWDASLRSAFEWIAECEAGAPHYQEAGVRGMR